MAALQIRNVPEEVHRELKRRAEERGMSLSEYALAELLRSMQQPTTDELAARIKALPPVEIGDAAVEIIRAHRDG